MITERQVSFYRTSLELRLNSYKAAKKFSTPSDFFFCHTYIFLDHQTKVNIDLSK